ncbi:MAG: NADAR family protein [Candidatus Omnitrophota bacterium]|nr:NADAR family protein [Candidatus Omnitrophota bacterium]
MSEIRFYRATGEYGFLSNLYLVSITLEGRSFDCAERAYQFGKPAKLEVAEWLRAAPTPSLCAQAAHALLPWQVHPNWAAVKVDRMRTVLRAKFFVHDNLLRSLYETGDAILIEDSKTDAFWGVGKKGTGKNMLGVLLMEVRSELQA